MGEVGAEPGLSEDESRLVSSRSSRLLVLPTALGDAEGTGTCWRRTTDGGALKGSLAPGTDTPLPLPSRATVKLLMLPVLLYWTLL